MERKKETDERKEGKRLKKKKKLGPQEWAEEQSETRGEGWSGACVRLCLCLCLCLGVCLCRYFLRGEARLDQGGSGQW
jgi:hypothetical protein